LQLNQLANAFFGQGQHTVHLDRVKATPSAVPCTSTKFPAPVITTFMSVSQAESSG